MKCCVPSCDFDSAVHDFPVDDKEQCAKWLLCIGDGELLNIESEELHLHYGVCDSHFEPSCHDSTTNNLIPGALPTLHLPDSGGHNRNSSSNILELPEVLGVLGHELINIRVDVEDIARRYSLDQKDDSDILINRPEDLEIVARYATKSENESEDEIILKYPNDDDVIRRYAAGSAHIFERKIVTADEVTSQSGVQSEADCELPSSNCSANEPTPGQSSSAEETDLAERRRLINEFPHSSAHLDALPASRGTDSELLESVEDSMSDLDGSEHPSDDDDVSMHRDLEEFNCASDFDDSCYDSVDADEAVRALMKPGCSSPQNHNITVYNLCCDKKFLSSISIDSPKNSQTARGTNRQRQFLQDLVMQSHHSDSFQDLHRNGFIGKKSRNRNKPKIARNDNYLLSVIHSLEKIAQNVETRCIEARRSLRKNSSHVNVIRTGAKLKGEVTTLLNSQLGLVKKIRTSLP